MMSLKSCSCRGHHSHRCRRLCKLIGRQHSRRSRRCRGSSYIALLRYLGIRNIRDGARNSSQIKLLNRVTGVRLNLVGGNLEEMLSVGQSLATTGALLAFEGPNEPNNWPITFKGQTGGGNGSWLPVAQFQNSLYQQVKTNSVLKQYPVFAVSEGGAETDNVGSAVPQSPRRRKNYRR